MEIRPVTAADFEALAEIDATVESSQYLHLDRGGEGLNRQWSIEQRPLRTKLIEPNPLSDEHRFLIRQIAGGIDEGIAVTVEHDGEPVALLLAQAEAYHGTLRLLDLRVDYDHRREGLATALVYQLIQAARDTELRAVAAETRANNFPANQLLAKLGFELAGLDTQRHSNHDLVKESVTLFWYAALD
jgi:RimJ/RimL family protein N-acetyltransferase